MNNIQNTNLETTNRSSNGINRCVESVYNNTTIKIVLLIISLFSIGFGIYGAVIASHIWYNYLLIGIGALVLILDLKMFLSKLHGSVDYHIQREASVHSNGTFVNQSNRTDHSTYTLGSTPKRPDSPFNPVIIAQDKKLMDKKNVTTTQSIPIFGNEIFPKRDLEIEPQSMWFYQEIEREFPLMAAQPIWKGKLKNGQPYYFVNIVCTEIHNIECFLNNGFLFMWSDSGKWRIHLKFFLEPLVSDDHLFSSEFVDELQEVEIDLLKSLVQEDKVFIKDSLFRLGCFDMKTRAMKFWNSSL